MKDLDKTIVLLIIGFVLLVSLCGLATYLIVSPDMESFNINVEKTEYHYDSGFADFDYTIVHCNETVLKLDGLQSLPLGNLTITVDKNGGVAHTWELISYKKKDMSE